MSRTTPDLPVAPRRLVVGISGASGAVYGIRILQMLQGTGIETHLVMSESARMTVTAECELGVKEIEALATEVHHHRNIGATISSGSFKTMGMVVAPCSIRSLAEIAYGNTTGLLTRAADVVLKERRRLVLMVRETPLHNGHLKAMLQATENGAVIMPPVPALYSRPRTVDDLIDHTVGRCLDLFDIDSQAVRRWTGMRATQAGDDGASS